MIKIINWIKKNKFLSLFSSVSLILLFLGFIFSFLKFKDYHSQFIIKYSNNLGIIFVGGIYELILIFITGIIIFLMNFILAKKFEERDKFFGKFIAVFNFVICLLIFIYFIAIINVN